MSEVAPTTPPATQPATPDYTLDGLDTDGKTEIYRSPKGAKFVPYDRFKVVNDNTKSIRDESAAAILALQKVADESAAAAEKARAEAMDWQLRAALVGKGITDPEDLAEFKDRYTRSPPDEAGKKPTPFEWANKVATAPPKWAAGYFGVTPSGAPPTPPASPAAPPAASPPVAPRVNNGTAPPPPAPAGRLTDAQVEAMTPRERIANAQKITEQTIRNPQLRAKLGMPPL